MATSINIALANFQTDNVGTDLDSGFIDIYDGTMPPDPSDPPAGTLLVSCALDADAYAAASGGIADANGPITGTAVATGTAQYAQQRNAANTRWMYEPCSLTPAAGIVALSSLTINTSDVITIDTSSIQQPTA